MEEKEGVGVLKLEETSRTYFFPNGNTFVIDDAVECRINKKNTHQLITRQGEIYIVPHRWLAMKYIPVVKDEKAKNEISKK